MSEERTPLQEMIDRDDVEAEIIFPGESTPTVPDAARALGVGEEQILKSLVFTNRAGDYVLAIASGTSRVSATKLAAASGIDDLKLARPEKVLEHTGYPVGAMPPVAHRVTMPVFVDERVATLSTAFAGGGRIDAMLRITPAEIIRVTDATVAQITT